MLSIGNFDFCEETIKRRQFVHVFFGWERMSRREVVLKIKSPEWNGDDILDSALPQEAKNCTKVQQYRGCAKIWDAGIAPNTAEGYANLPYVISDRVLGPTLAEWIQKEGQIAPETVARIILPLAQILKQIHGDHVVHHDVKPSNIILRAANDPVLIDFGAGKVYGDFESWRQKNYDFATPRYIAPERALGGAPSFCPQSDVYSLGLVMFEMLVGRHPFLDRPDLTSLENQADLQGVPTADLTRDVFLAPAPQIDVATPRNVIPCEIKSICEACLEPDFAQRLSASDVASRLEKWLATPSSRHSQWRRSSSRYAMIAACVGVLGTVITGLTLHSNSQQIKDSVLSETGPSFSTIQLVMTVNRPTPFKSITVIEDNPALQGKNVSLHFSPLGNDDVGDPIGYSKITNGQYTIGPEMPTVLNPGVYVVEVRYRNGKFDSGIPTRFNGLITDFKFNGVQSAVTID